MAFKLKSGNNPGFKMMGASPYKKPLVGNQDKLPEHLQQKILDSPAKQTTNIVGEQTFEARKNKNKDQLELGLSTDRDKSPQPEYGTHERLIVKPGDNVLDSRGNKLSEGGFIEQMTPMEIQKDSTSVSGKDYYSIKKSPAKQKKENAVYHERIAKRVMTKDGMVTNPEIERLKNRPQAKGYTPRHQSHDGYAYQDGVRVEDKKSPAKQGVKLTPKKGDQELSKREIRRRKRQKTEGKRTDPEYNRPSEVERRFGSALPQKKGKYEVDTRESKGQSRIKFTNKRGKSVGYTATDKDFGKMGQSDYTVTKTKGGKTKEISKKKYKRQIGRKLDKQV